MRNLPGGGGEGFVFCERLTRRVESHRKSKIQLLEESFTNQLLEDLFTLLDFRPEKIVITASTVSVRQNCSISFWAAQGGHQFVFRMFGHPCYNYEVQSTWLARTIDTTQVEMKGRLKCNQHRLLMTPPPVDKLC